MKKLFAQRFLFLLGTLMFLVIFLTIYTTSAYASSILFQDNFDDGNADGWSPISGESLWQVKEINGNKMYGARINSSSTIIDSVAVNVSSPNYKIDFDYLPIANSTTTTVDRNLDFRYRRNSPTERYNPYEVHFLTEYFFWTNFGYYTPTSSTPLVYNQTNHVTIILQDKHIKFFLNGISIIDYVDTSYNFTGDEKIGLRIGTGDAYPTEAWFDNIVVISLDEPTPISLNVPLLKQSSDPWQAQIYDTANKWAPTNPTINSWGCALTSGTMVLNYHGINKLPNGTTLNPGTLNSWLKSQKDGYIGTGWVNWLALSRLSKLAKSINNITAFDALQYNRTSSEDKNKLTTDINNLLPDILEVTDHFIVAKGINGNTFNINDPYYNRNTLNDYSNTFLTLGTYTPSFTNLSYIMISADSEINISLKDFNNNIVGENFIQQPLVSDDNSAQSNSSIKIFYLPKPQTQDYHLTISSSIDKVYDLHVYLYDQDGNVNVLDQNGLIGPDRTDNFTISFDKQNSSNSKNTKIITFQSLIDDINEAKNLKFINNNGVYNSLLAKATISQIINQINKNTSKNILNSLLNELNAQKEKHITEDSYQILIYDINYLKTQ